MVIENNNPQHDTQAPDEYTWPAWSKELGEPPKIVFKEQADKVYVEKLNEVLTNIANMSRIPGADALRTQLKELSGIPINIQPMQGKEQENLANETTPARGGKPPFINFNPDAWGKYPAKGAVQLEAAHYSLPDMSLPLSEWPASMGHGKKYSEYGIAPPEQQFLHELGHYINFYHEDQTSIPLSEHFALLRKGKDEYHIAETYENPSMKSANPEFIERALVSGTSTLLPEGDNGLPVVGPEDRKALEIALKFHPVKNAVPEPEQTAPSKATDQQSRIDELTPAQKVMAAIDYIQKLPESQRGPYLQNVVDYANKHEVSIVETQQQYQALDQGLQQT